MIRKAKTLDEFVDRDVSNFRNLNDGKSHELRFTGNWFIDAGILGFVNLMEEVYGWGLEELQKRIKEEPEIVYYWYFPIGYISHVIREAQSKKGLEKIKEITNVLRKIPKAPETTNTNDLFDKAWEWVISNEPLTETKKGKKRIKLSWSGKYRILTNFPLFQPGYDIEKQKNILMGLLGLKEIEDELLIYIDKATSKFLPSLSDFPNISYTKSCITIHNLFKLNPKAPIFILTYPLAFISDSELLIQLKHQIMIYSPELKFTYIVNKKLRKYIEKSEQEHSDILKITWRSIIDSLTEIESIWSLENMYMIKVKPPTGQRQDLENVEYIGIPKLQASIILDDAIRDALNKYIPTPKLERGRRIWIWLLEEFIKNKPLLPYLIDYLHEYLSGRLNTRIGNRTLIYANSVDAQLREFGKSNNLFSDEFFRGYKSVLFEIKENTTRMFLAAKSVYRIFDDRKERERIANTFLSTIRKRNKYAFANILLKSFIGKTEKQKEIRSLNRYLFDKIVSNDINWENYALAIVIGLIYGGDESGEFEESEE